MASASTSSSSSYATVNMDDFVDHARYGEIEDLVAIIDAQIAVLQANDPAIAADWGRLRQAASISSSTSSSSSSSSSSTSEPTNNNNDNNNNNNDDADGAAASASSEFLPIPAPTTAALTSLLVTLATTRSSETGHTALHVAAANDEAAVLSLLLAAFPVVNDNVHGLLAAAGAGTSDNKAFTTVAAASPRTSLDGSTPLHFACINGHLRVVERLLAVGASATVKNDDGRSAVTVAEQQGHLEIVNLLLRTFDPDDDDEENGDTENNSNGGGGESAMAVDGDDDDGTADVRDATNGVKEVKLG